MMNGTSQAHTPTLQDMVKAAQTGALSRSRIATEAQRQLDNVGGEKTAEEMCEKCKKPMEHCTCKAEKKGSASKVSTAYATKAAEALEYLAHELKTEKKAAPNAPPPHMTERTVGPGEGPGAIEVSHATASTPLPDHKGQGHQQPPMKPGGEKVLKGEHGETQMATNMDHPTHGTTPQKTVGKTAAAELYKANLTKMLGKEAAEKVVQTKTAAAELYKKNCERMGIKVAEDAIFPAHITAGPAVAPETSQAGQPGGAPAGGMPQGRKGTDSNQSSIDITKGQAKSDPKSDLKKWFDEPALSGSTDSTLSAAFDNTGRAGTKYASKDEQGDEKVATAAARALLESLLESVKGPKAA
jgi:hypothetical protein